jgi:hypothetical protein
MAQASAPRLAEALTRGLDTMPFALLTILLVLALVAVLLGIFFLVRRWL